MKKFLILITLLAIGLFMGDAFALNAYQAQGVDQPDNWYIEVEYNDGGATGGSRTAVQYAGHGDCLEWDLDANTGETLGYTVHRADADTAAGVENMAGVVPAYNDYSHNLDNRGLLTDGDRFLMQIRGYHAAVSCDGNVVEGQGIESEGATATAGTFGDGEGLGFAFKDDAADTTTEYTSTGNYYAPVWLNVTGSQE